MRRTPAYATSTRRAMDGRRIQTGRAPGGWHTARAGIRQRRVQRQHRPNPKYPTLESVDTEIYELAADDLRDKCADFIERHHNVFVR